MTIYEGETSLETRKQAEELLAELRRQAYAEGYEQAKRDVENNGVVKSTTMSAHPFLTAQQDRDLIDDSESIAP